MKVLDMTRECQYCWDGKWGRVRCGRLAYFAGMTRVNGNAMQMQIYYRCREHHQEPVQIGTAQGPMTNNINDSLMELFKVSKLGYKP